jgi:Putative redox-active protein (C_GCAxxG_C_C)
MELEQRAAAPLAGGLMRGYQCGMIWGAALAGGAQANRIFGKGPQAEAGAIITAQKVVESFRAQNKAIDCSEITGIDISGPKPQAIIWFLAKTAATGSCFGMAARYARAAYSEINAASSDMHIEALPAPVSCSAMLAQRMGASGIQTVMAAGLAGGIGLSGGACGALGAALWIIGMNSLKQSADRIGLNPPAAVDAIERFAKCTNNEFECSKIVGRQFESVNEQASYLRAGGCSKIIEALATR